MNNRIKELRKYLNMNLESFGTLIGKAANTISQYENGKRNIDDTTVLLICKTFNVSEKWLREGLGSIFNEDKVVANTKSLTDIQKRIIDEIYKLTDDQISSVLIFIETMKNINTVNKPGKKKKLSNY